MPLEQDLRNEIQAALHGLSVLGLSQKVACDLYELFVVTIIIEAAKSQGPVQIDHYDRNGQVTTNVRCPTAPRAIGRGDYTYVRIGFPGKKLLEVHLGIYVLGKSKVKHECDVVMLLHEEAENCRRRTKPLPNPAFHPLTSSVIGYTECKCYDKSQLTIGHGRGFLGLSQDVRSPEVCAALVSTKDHDEIKKLLLAHKKVAGFGLTPGNNQEIQWLRGKFADSFHAFKQKP